MPRLLLQTPNLAKYLFFLYLLRLLAVYFLLKIEIGVLIGSVGTVDLCSEAVSPIVAAVNCVLKLYCLLEHQTQRQLTVN